MIYEEIFIEFEKRNVRYLVAGGMAVNLYGYVRMTMDLDIMVDLADENLKKIIAVMEENNYKPRIPIKSNELISKDKRDEWIKEKGAIVFTFINYNEPYKNIDIFLNNPVDFEEAYSRKEVIVAGNVKINLVSLDDIIKMKRSAGRPRDVEDIKHLEKCRKFILKEKKNDH